MSRPLAQEIYTRCWAELKDHVHARLVGRLDPRRVATISNPQVLRLELRLVVERLVDAENPPLNLAERERLIEEVVADAFGFGPLEMLFRDDRVREIRIENPERILVRRQESFELAQISFRSLEQLYLICGRLLSAAAGQQVDSSVKAVVDMEVPPNFLMTVEFPVSRVQSPILHFRRLQEPSSTPEVPVCILPGRD